MGFYTRAGAPTPFDPSNRFETSYILSPHLLGSIRLLFSLYAFTTMIIKITHNISDADNSFSYFTNICFWAMAFYFLVAGGHTLAFARTKRAPLQKWPRVLQFAHSLFYTTIVVFPFMLTAVYWVLLAPKDGFKTTYDAWNNISCHALNSFFALCEIFLTRANPMPFLHLGFLILFMAGYIGVAYITKATKGFYTYDFLDPNKGGSGRVAAYAFGIAAGTIVLFVVVWAVQKLKVWLFERVAGKREGSYEGVALVEKGGRRESV